MEGQHGNLAPLLDKDVEPDSRFKIKGGRDNRKKDTHSNEILMLSHLDESISMRLSIEGAIRVSEFLPAETKRERDRDRDRDRE